MLFSNNNSDDIFPKNDTFESEGVENWENSKEEEIESTIPKNTTFIEAFPTIESLVNFWRKGNGEEIAKLAGCEATDLATLKNIWKECQRSQ